MKRGVVTDLMLALTLCSVTLSSQSCSNYSLVGRWTKSTSGICDIVYPQQIEFFKDGTYIGALPNWNGGTGRSWKAADLSSTPLWDRRYTHFPLKTTS